MPPFKEIDLDNKVPFKGLKIVLYTTIFRNHAKKTLQDYMQSFWDDMLCILGWTDGQEKAFHGISQNFDFLKSLKSDVHILAHVLTLGNSKSLACKLS